MSLELHTCAKGMQLVTPSIIAIVWHSQTIIATEITSLNYLKRDLTGRTSFRYAAQIHGEVLLPGMDLDWNLDWTGMGFLFYQL